MANEIERGALYVVGTPIGNLSDMTERAKYVLANVNFVAAEDTRVSGKLLSCFDIKNSFVSYHEHNKAVAGKQIVERLLSGETGAIVTDAGVPALIRRISPHYLTYELITENNEVHLERLKEQLDAIEKKGGL